MNPSLIWGTILVLLGLSLILKSIFHITIPLVRPFFGCILIYLGLSIMMDPFTDSPDKKSIIFGRSKITGQSNVTTYNVTFGSGEIDLSHIDITSQTAITINTVLGSSVITLNPHIPTKVRVNALVARAGLPDETLVSFGRNVYTTSDDEPRLILQANVVLGNLEVVLSDRVMEHATSRDKETDKEANLQPLEA